VRLAFHWLQRAARRATPMRTFLANVSVRALLDAGTGLGIDSCLGQRSRVFPSAGSRLRPMIFGTQRSHFECVPLRKGVSDGY